MKHFEGAAAPFSHFPLCSPQQRGDALLTHALEAFQDGHHLDALLAVEYVCRRHAEKSLPAILRARIVESCQPQLAARAWYQAWSCDPENAALQDALLACWLRMGAMAQVRELGQVFLPGRCRECSQAPLLALLAQAGMPKAGACWVSGDVLEIRLFHLLMPPQTEVLHISDRTLDVSLSIHASTGSVRLDRPRHGQVFSIAFADGQLLQGSPLIFPAPAMVPQAHPRHQKAVHAVDIVVPVYRGLQQVQTCLNSVLRSLPHNRIKARLVVVDDASPEPALRDWLAQLARQNHCVLLCNRYNLGFVEAANRGMRHHGGHDVMLLNADTEVHGNWLDRLHASLHAAGDIAAVTPWSNNGEISSFPLPAKAAPVPDSRQLAELDAVAASLAPDCKDLELPACCGFAMMIKRSVLNQIGLLDGAGFYRGYGEEVDWCLRARAAGFRHMLAVNVFVAHAGGISFGMEKVLRVRQNRALILARYPRYYSEYHLFTGEDALASVRSAFMARGAHLDWLQQRAAALQPPPAFLPQAMPSGVRRIAVWQHQSGSPGNAPLLQLARTIASRPGWQLRLLMFGDIGQAFWDTGVVDAIPVPKDGQLLFSDRTLLDLAGCVAILAEPGKWHAADMRYHPIGPGFDTARFLQQFAPVPQADQADHADAGCAGSDFGNELTVHGK